MKDQKIKKETVAFLGNKVKLQLSSNLFVFFFILFAMIQ